MARSTDKSFYNSKAWEVCRTDYLKKVNYLCERCKAKGIYEPARVVHHKIYLNKENFTDPSVSLNFDNLEALCQECHNKEHFKEDKDRRFTFDKDGNLVF